MNQGQTTRYLKSDKKAPQIANGEDLLIGKKPFPRVGDLTKGRKNKLCRRCRHTCKQSANAKILRCPQFEAKEVKEDKDGDKEKD